MATNICGKTYVNKYTTQDSSLAKICRDARMLLDRACDIIQKGGEVFPDSRRPCAAAKASCCAREYRAGAKHPLLAAVTLRDFVALAICIPPQVGGVAAAPRPQVRDESWSDLTQLRQEGSARETVS